VGLPISRFALAAGAPLLIITLSSAPLHAETWDPDDVLAAERYRDEERARAERYRAGLERTTRETPAARPQGGPSRPGPRPEIAPPGRLADRVRASLDASLAELVDATEGWLTRQIEGIEKALEDPPARKELRRTEPEPRDPLGDWIARERERARRLLEGGR
jgi:hypothetical protein